MEEIAKLVTPTSKMYIVPPRRNAIYYVLGTRTANPDGYWFFLRDLDTMPWKDCAHVLLLTGGLDSNDYQFSSLGQIAQVRQLLKGRGFRQKLGGRLRAMQLYENPLR